jgi:hypothetical protein
MMKVLNACIREKNSIQFHFVVDNKKIAVCVFKNDKGLHSAHFISPYVRQNTCIRNCFLPHSFYWQCRLQHLKILRQAMWRH